jgi:phosphatidylglycerol:prolipoprotein diacylglycerol transferase
LRPTIDLYLIELPVYTALVGLGVAVGLLAAYLYLRARSRRLSRLDLFLDGALLALAVGWIGARAYHVIMGWDYYQTRSEEIAPLSGLWEGSMPGGLGIRGALLLGLAAVALYAAVRRLSFWHLADAAALGLAVGQAIGWAGALAQGANYGIVSDSRLAMELPDLYGLVAPRFPLQHVEMLVYAVVCGGLLVLAAQNRPPGTLFFVYLIAVSLSNATLGFQRGDETAYWGGLRIDQIVDALWACAAMAGWMGRWWIAQRFVSPLEGVRPQ